MSEQKDELVHVAFGQAHKPLIGLRKSWLTRKVHNKLNIEAEVMKQYAPDDISRDIVARMAQMTVVINSRTTGIP